MRLPFLILAVKDTLKEFVLRLKGGRRRKPDEGCPFGSMARGDFDEESDTDVFVLLKEGDEFQKLMEVSDICFGYLRHGFDNPENSEQWYVLLSPVSVETEQSIKRAIKGIPRWRLEPVFDAIREEGVTLFDVGANERNILIEFSTEIQDALDASKDFCGCSSAHAGARRGLFAVKTTVKGTYS